MVVPLLLVMLRLLTLAARGPSRNEIARRDVIPPSDTTDITGCADANHFRSGRAGEDRLVV